MASAGRTDELVNHKQWQRPQIYRKVLATLTGENGANRVESRLHLLSPFPSAASQPVHRMTGFRTERRFSRETPQRDGRAFRCEWLIVWSTTRTPVLLKPISRTTAAVSVNECQRKIRWKENRFCETISIFSAYAFTAGDGTTAKRNLST